MRLFAVGRMALQRLASRSGPEACPSVALSINRLFDTHPSFFSSASPEKRPGFYDQLKKEERKQFGRKRARFDYQSNYTFALALPYSRTQLNHQWDDEAALLNLCKNHIIEHATRRVDLFFYTLIAYYQSTILPVEGHTSLQHGIGQIITDKGLGTQACHSSFTPALLDETIFKNKGDEVKYKSLLCGTHFLESLNATVELPPFVNLFDDILESICRPKSMAILHNVSLDKMDPIEGLVDFLGMMSVILQEFKRQASSEKYTSLTYPNLPGQRYVHPKLIDLIIEGTLDNAYDTESNTVNDCYVQLLLRMTAEEKKRSQHNAKHKGKLYIAKIMAIQREILESERQDDSCAHVLL